MSDYSELKRLLEACKESNCADASDFGRRIADLYDYLDPETVAENERLAALLECAQGDLRQAMQIIEKNGILGFSDALYQVAERLGVTGARPFSPMQVFETEVLPALDAVIKNSERYLFLKNLPDDDCLIERLECATDPENWDSVIDAAMSKEG